MCNVASPLFNTQKHIRMYILTKSPAVLLYLNFSLTQKLIAEKNNHINWSICRSTIVYLEGVKIHECSLILYRILSVVFCKPSLSQNWPIKRHTFYYATNTLRKLKFSKTQGIVELNLSASLFVRVGGRERCV